MAAGLGQTEIAVWLSEAGRQAGGWYPLLGVGGTAARLGIDCLLGEILEK